MVKISKAIDPEIKFPFESKQVRDGITSLQNANKWPKNKRPTPAYKDDNSTLYLQILPVKFDDKFVKIGKWPHLPHPLSFIRNVCFILGSDFDPELENNLKSLTKTLGVEGDISVTSTNDIQQKNVLKNDTIVSNVYAEVCKLLQKEIENEAGKAIYNFLPSSRVGRLKRNIAVILKRTFVFKNQTNDGYLMRVGHTGLKSEELVANILVALGSLQIEKRLKGGWRNVGSLGLKTGSSEAVSIFKATAESIAKLGQQHQEKLPTKRKSELAGENERPAKKRKRSKGGKKILAATTGSLPGAAIKQKRSNIVNKTVIGHTDAGALTGIKRPINGKSEVGSSPLKKVKEHNKIVLVSATTPPAGRPLDKKAKKKTGRRGQKAVNTAASPQLNGSPVKTTQATNVAKTKSGGDVAVNQQGGASPVKKGKKNKHAKNTGDSEALTQVAGSPTKKAQNLVRDLVNNSQEGISPAEKENKKAEGASPVGLDLVNLLLKRAKDSVSTPKPVVKDASVRKRHSSFPDKIQAENVTVTDANEIKKSKKKKPVEKMGTVLKDGELSLEFKQKLMSSLQKFTRGTEFEDIVGTPAAINVSPVKSGKRAHKRGERAADQTPKEANVYASLGTSASLSKKKNKSPKGAKTLSPVQTNGHSAKKVKKLSENPATHKTRSAAPKQN